jgi:hypothetical protein
MKRILLAATIITGLALASCGNQNQTPNTNSPTPADTSTSSPNAPNSSDTGTMMNSDTAGGHSMQDSAMPK